jgi:hypothetical protein
MIVLAYGMPGMGKTTWMHDYVRAHLSLGYRWLIVDHAEEWTESGAHWRGEVPPLTVVEEGERKPDLTEPGVYVFRGWEGLDVARLTVEWGNAVYVDDELDLVARKQAVLGVSWDDSPLRKIVHQGRHLYNREGELTECHILGACRRPQSLHTDVSEQASHVVVFRVQGGRTLERLRYEGTIEDGEWERVRTLPPFHYREWPSGLWGQVKPIARVKREGDAHAAPELGTERAHHAHPQAPIVRIVK